MKKSLTGVVINDYFLSQVSVARMLDREGCSGLGMLVEVCLYLKKCYHVIGRLDDDRIIASKARKNARKCREWITGCNIFDVDEVRGLFTLGMYRKMFKLGRTITDREAEVVRIYGNCICREPEEYTASHPVGACAEGAISEKSSKDKCTADGRKIIAGGAKNENCNVQVSDNKAVAPSLLVTKRSGDGIGMGIRAKAKNIPIPTSTVYDCDKTAAEGEGGFKKLKNFLISDDDVCNGVKAGAEEDGFKKFENFLFSDTAWRKCTSEARGIDLTSDDLMHKFCRWMYDYCISNNTLPADMGGVQHYASCLLSAKKDTRQCFNDYLRRAGGSVPSVKPVLYTPPRNRGTFESLKDGVRIGMGGQVLPPEAPPQYNMNDRWSYIEHRYVDVKVFDEVREMAFYAEEQRRREQKQERCRKIIEACGRQQREEERSRRAASSMAGEGVLSVGEIIRDSIFSKRGGCCGEGDAAKGDN